MYPEIEAKHFLRTIKEEHIQTAALTTNSLHSAKNQHVLICCGVRKTCFIDGAGSVFFSFPSDFGGLFLSSWHGCSTVHDIQQIGRLGASFTTAGAVIHLPRNTWSLQ